MAHPTQPPSPPYSGWADPLPPARSRPHAAWFVPGFVAVVLALMAAVWCVVQLVDLFRTDAVLLSDGRPHSVELRGRGADRMLFAPVGESPPQCRVTGPDGRTMVPPKQITSNDTLGTGDRDWRPFAEFTAPRRAVQVQCTSDFRTPVRVGAPLDGGTFVPIGLAFIGVLGFGALGGISLLVVAILFFTRPTRQVAG